ncbi:MAG: CAP domain-containing protein [Candidatus Pacebacteria bacterium]|jgi:uncharacterized protein YkwD|nr:CAP domain-containing protein [Candidatus Paceibacterota bacterium]
MWERLGTILAGILGLVMAAALSFTYLEQSVGPRDEAPVAKQATTTQTAEKQVATKVSTPTKTNGSLVPKTTSTQKTVVAPGPLRSTTKASPASLTVSGVIAYTNAERANNGGLSALTENALLDRDAQLKLDDMFNKQYFEHVSPSGVGPSDLATLVGYQYVIVGENLALGDFAGDEGVVTAWMNSPGHRANILNTNYEEIGVAVGKGMYEGRETWLAVQSFGMPISSCPAIDAKLKAKIEENNKTIAILRTQLDAKKAQIDATPKSDPAYNTYVEEFNILVPQYNNLVETNRFNVTTYNGGVQAFNACIAAVGSASPTH